MISRLRDWLGSNQTGGVIARAGRLYAEDAAKDRTIHMLSGALADLKAQEAQRTRDIEANDQELLEAVMMSGAGPWRMPAGQGTEPRAVLREAIATGQGAFGDTELWLQNIEWRREGAASWLEFSRWGIQQIILISRLRSIKDPMLLRGINVSAQYVFGRGVEVSSPDADANEVIKSFMAANVKTLGPVALAELERTKYRDGNLFFACHSDTTNKGTVDVRMIDALEIQDIISDPDDSETPRYYHRAWIQKEFNKSTGTTDNTKKEAWYPAIGYVPAAGEKADAINSIKVMWDVPVLHRKCGSIGKWQFGLPLVYAALGYAKAVKSFLEDCMTIRNSLAQFSMILTTKGGQQAMAGMKQQLSTTVGPSASLWDQNPTAVSGSIAAMGPGSKLEAFKTSGAAADPGDVREYKLQVAMTFGCPESFWADMNTSNLATATSLDRPTELNFMEKQEVWVEDLTTLAKYALTVSKGAPSGQFREALANRKVKDVVIREGRRIRRPNGDVVYEAVKPAADVVTVQVNFPTIIEADVPAQVSAVVEAMTLGNASGGVTGIDERAGVGLLYRLVDVENPEELLEEQYPSEGVDAYDPKREKVDPAETAALAAAAAPKKSATVEEAMNRLSKAFSRFRESR